MHVVVQDNDIIPAFALDRRYLNINYLTSDYYIGMSLNITNDKKFYATLYYSTMAFHSSANAINEITNLYLAYLTNDFTKKITTYNMPFKTNNSLYFGDEFIKYLACLDILPASFFNMLTSMILVIIISLMVINIAGERLSGSKTLQLLTGTRSLTYWASNYFFDLTIIVFNFTSMVIVFKLVDVIRNDDANELRPIAASETIGYVYLLLLVSAFSCCSLAYIWSFFFKSELVGFIVLTILLGVAAFVDMLISFILLFINVDNTKTKDNTAFNVFTTLQMLIYIVFPNVTVKHGLYNLKIRKNTYFGK